MIKRKQLFSHDPRGAGTIGDCHRTALACLVDLEPADVPHFAELSWDFGRGTFVDDGETFNRLVAEWLASAGLSTVCVVYGCPLEDVLRTQGLTNPGTYYLLGGQSRNGVNHTVVCLEDRIEWDPAIDGSGIVGPCDDGYYWVTYLVPLFTKVRQGEPHGDGV